PPELDGSLSPPATSAGPSLERAVAVDRAGSTHRAAPCSRRGHSAPSCRASNGPEPPGSREYPQLAPEDAWRSCDAYAHLGISAIIPSPGLCRALGLFPPKTAAFRARRCRADPVLLGIILIRL